MKLDEKTPQHEHEPKPKAILAKARAAAAKEKGKTQVVEGKAKAKIKKGQRRRPKPNKKRRQSRTLPEPLALFLAVQDPARSGRIVLTCTKLDKQGAIGPRRGLSHSPTESMSACLCHHYTMSLSSIRTSSMTISVAVALKPEYRQ